MRRVTDAGRIALLGGLLTLSAASSAHAGDPGGPPFTWVISASSTDPGVNVDVPTFGVKFLYLWVLPTEPSGWNVSCFELVAQGQLLVLSVTPQPGIDITDGCFFSFGGCPTTPVIAAVVLVLDFPGGLCLGPSLSGGTNCTVDCHEPPGVWMNSWIGYTNVDPQPCSFESFDPCGTVSVDPGSWGRLKAGYR